jgi:SAM-dependent methyltransferase
VAERRVSAHYRDRLGDEYYSRLTENGFEIAELARRKFARYVRPDDSVVDFGCGTGHLLVILEARDKIGVEVVEASRKAAGRLGVRTVASIEELDAGSADVVVSHHALEHVRSPVTELEQMHRVLKHGGRLVLRLPLDDWRVQREVRDPDIDNHLYAWTPRLLANLLREAGFRPAEIGVVDCAYPGRLSVPLARVLPPRAFELVAAVTARVLRRRELHAVAVKG